MLLDIRNLHVEFHTYESVIPAVDGVSLTLDRGQVLCLAGESGCGKSATALSIPRLLPMPPARITAGEIIFEDDNLLTMSLPSLRKLRGERIGVIFQDPMSSLSPLHRVGRQLAEVITIHRKVSPATARERAIEWLGRVGIPEPEQRINAYPHELSGGMQQRVMIAMALMLEPDLIIADEPTTALDVTIQAQILAIMRKLLSANAALLLITHDMGVVAQMATHVAVMYAGQIVEEAEAAAFFDAPAHPYSKALLDAMPSMARRGQRLKAIPGQVPMAGDFPTGCRFHDRCPIVRPECAQVPPELALYRGRKVRCPWCRV